MVSWTWFWSEVAASSANGSESFEAGKIVKSRTTLPEETLLITIRLALIPNNVESSVFKDASKVSLSELLSSPAFEKSKSRVNETSTFLLSAFSSITFPSESNRTGKNKLEKVERFQH